MKSHNKFLAKISTKEYIPILKGIVDIFLKDHSIDLLRFKTQDTSHAGKSLIRLLTETERTNKASLISVHAILIFIFHVHVI